MITMDKLISRIALTVVAVGLLSPAWAQDVITVASSSVGATTTLGGTVVPLKEVTFSAQLPGRVEFIAGIEGDWFRRDTVLVALDDDDLLAKRRSAKAQLAKATAAWRNARVQYSRQVIAGPAMGHSSGMGVPSMIDEKFTRPMSRMMGDDDPELIRRSQIYARGTQIDQARASLDQVQAQLEELDALLRDTQSISPFSGVIVSKMVEVGDTVQPGQPLMGFADTRHLQIKVDIPARLMPGVRKSMIIPAKLDVGDARINARVAQIYPMADSQRHTVTVKLDLPMDAPGGPGMYAEVMIPDITTPVESMPTIPTSAVIWRGSLPAVFALTDDNRTELRMIRLGGFVDDETVSVLSGLHTGERILAHPSDKIASRWEKSGGAIKD